MAGAFGESQLALIFSNNERAVSCTPGFNYKLPISIYKFT
jgi:hypothetical protein